ncbi:30S ribosomal protein S6 [Candidatus Omnitrophota bacterium]
MKNYKGLFLLRPDLEQEELSDLYQKIQDNIKKYKGEVEGVEEWGKKSLAFKIGKYREGIYYLLSFKMNSLDVVHLNTDIKLNDLIMRAMIT